MEFLKVHDWDDFRYHKDDRPLNWICVYHKILDNYKFETLSDAEFGQLVKIWLFAARQDNKIPNDPNFIQKKCSLSQKPNISKFIELNFLESYTDDDTSVRIRTISYESVPKLSKVSKEKKDKECHLQYVFLLPEEYERLIEDYGQTVVDSKIEDLNNYIGSKGKKYKDHNLTLRAWLKKDGVKIDGNGENGKRHLGPFGQYLQSKIDGGAS